MISLQTGSGKKTDPVFSSKAFSRKLFLVIYNLLGFPPGYFDRNCVNTTINITDPQRDNSLVSRRDLKEIIV